MKRIILTILLSSLLVITFDTLASLASLHLQIDYSLFRFGSFFIYIYIGFYFAGYGSLLWSAVGAGIAALVDSTIGWYISWVIGPGNPGFDLTATDIFTAIISVILAAMCLGFLGGLFNRLLRRQIS